FVEASAAFVVDIVVAVAVTMVTRPRPASELGGLVWSLTSRESFGEVTAGEGGWYRKPAVLGTGVLALALALNIVFW
ncbi:MAG: Na+/galactose cotransporter, partial [Sciscionella sp.]